MYGQRTRPSPFKLNNLFNEHLPQLFFLRVFFRVKPSEVKKIAIEKWYNRWFNLLPSMLLPGPDLHCVERLVLLGFSQHLPAKYKYVLPSEHRATGSVTYGKYGTSYCIMFIKKVR